LPRLVGVPLDRDRLAVVHTGTGEVLTEVEAGSGEIVVVMGERVLRSVVTRQDGICRPEVTAYDPANGEPAWGAGPVHHADVHRRWLRAARAAGGYGCGPGGRGTGRQRAGHRRQRRPGAVAG